MEPVHPRFSLNQITTPKWSVPELVAACERRGVPAVALWRHKIEETGLAETARLVRDAGLRVSTVCRGGMFPAPSAQERQARIDDNYLAIEEAATLGADALVLVCGSREGHSLRDARGMVRDGIEAILPRAKEAGVVLGIEPFHPMLIEDRSVIVTLQEANDLVDYFGDPNCGVTFDAYHLFWDPRLDAEIARAAGHIVSNQISDWVLPIEGGLTSRGMLGDGSIDLPGICTAVDDTGYAGFVEVEILSSKLGAEDHDQLLDSTINRFNACMAAAEALRRGLPARP
ncbi:MAG: sugar phosphate isomerase/epimerase [Acidimicrobiia bacterium]|nr:sugar phosphate isomerase/epimerase [Acidimicrobiia bacterium]